MQRSSVNPAPARTSNGTERSQRLSSDTTERRKLGAGEIQPAPEHQPSLAKTASSSLPIEPVHSSSSGNQEDRGAGVWIFCFPEELQHRAHVTRAASNQQRSAVGEKRTHDDGTDSNLQPLARRGITGKQPQLPSSRSEPDLAISTLATVRNLSKRTSVVNSLEVPVAKVRKPG